MSQTQVFNVFHHSSQLTVACRNQSDATSCWPNRTIRDAFNRDFGVSNASGTRYDQAGQKLYVFGTRSDATAGVVCVDPALASISSNPFCGFTALTPVGEAPMPFGQSALSNPVEVGSKWYAYNAVDGVASGGATGSTAQNRLLCFDVATGAECAGQPFKLNLGAGTASNGYFTPAAGAIGDKVIAQARVGGTQKLTCFDAATATDCAGSWPVVVPDTDNGSPFPKLDASGSVTGFCTPTSPVRCFSMSGASAALPAGIGSVIGGSSWGSSPYNGEAVTIGARVYVPNGQGDGYSGQVECYDYSTSSGCGGFPKTFGGGLWYLYTVNPDPQRPTCLWVNADGGSAQIQNFDAYTGGACGQGSIRVLMSQFVVGQQKCYPVSYGSLELVAPARSAYTSGTVEFADAGGNPLTEIPTKTIDGNGLVDLSGLGLESGGGLPQFIVSLTGASDVTQITVKLTWTAPYDEACVDEDTTAAPDDADAPITTDDAPAGWQNTDVTVHLTATDGDGSGVASTHYSVDGGTEQTGTTVALSDEGVHEVAYYSVDEAGNEEEPSTATVRIDKTAPTIVATRTPANAAGWNNSAVTVSYACDDDRSGVASCGSDDVLSSEGAGQSASGSVTDEAGNTASATMSGIDIDLTNPVVALSGGGTYTVDQSVTIACSATDALSGVASSTCSAVEGTKSALDYGVGSTTVGASATDKAGNSGSDSATVKVIVTQDGLCALTTRYLTKKQLANSFCVKLKQATLGSYRNEVSAQSGKAFSAADAATLIELSKLLG